MLQKCPVTKDFAYCAGGECLSDLINAATFRQDILKNSHGSQIVIMSLNSIWVEASVVEESEAMKILEEVMATVVEFSVPLEVNFD